MKLSITPRILVTALALTAGIHATAADQAPQSKTLVDFTREEVERDFNGERRIHRYDFAWGAWQDKLVFLEKRGLLVPALGGDGVFGANSRLAFGASTHAEIDIVIGNRNAADAITFSLVDGDGTVASWYLPLKDKPKGQPLTYRINLEKPDNVDDAGKKAGLDKAKTKKWELKGNWQPPVVEVLFVRIAAAPPPPKSGPAGKNDAAK